jgi:hypothetical protein
MTLRNKKWQWPATAALAITLLTLSGSQCSQVGDRAVGPDSGSLGNNGNGVSACVQACNDIAKSDRDAEKDLHKENVRACNGDKSCLDAEKARHEARMEEIAAAQKACKAPCHEQGRGGGGQ